MDGCLLIGAATKFSDSSSSDYPWPFHVNSYGHKVPSTNYNRLNSLSLFFSPLVFDYRQLALCNFSPKMILPFTTSILTVPGSLLQLKNLSAEVWSL